MPNLLSNHERSPVAGATAPREAMEGLLIEGVSHTFRTESGETVQALDEVSLKIPLGEFLTVVGPSGCGKSTLLKIAAGLLRPSSGSVIFRGKAVEAPSRERGVVFQDLALLPWRNVAKNIGHGLEIAGVVKAERERRVQELIRLVGLEGFGKSYMHELSGGMRQRVAVARTWATDPPAILMDEPFGAVDAQTRLSLQEELRRLVAGSNKSIMFITHSVEEALFLGDRVVVMSRRPGRIKLDIDLRGETKPDTSEEFVDDARMRELSAQVLHAVRSDD